MQFYCIGVVQGGPKTSQYLVWPPFASSSATHLRIELIRLLIVACGMLVHSSSMAVRSCWILAGTGTRCRICRSRASQTCSMGDMSAEYAGHARTGMFSPSRNCVQILATCTLSCCNTRWWSWMNATTMGLRISSQYLCAFKMPSIKCTCVRCPKHTPAHTITLPPPWATQSTKLTSENRSPTQCHTRCLPSALYSENRDSSVKRRPLQSARRHRMWAFAQVCYDNKLQSGRDPDEDEGHIDEFPRDGFWQFVQKFFGYAKRFLQQLSGWLVSDDLGGEDTRCGCPGLVWLYVVCDCESG